MTMYGDLDVSILREKPPGRTPVVTKWADGAEQEREAWADVRSQVAQGRQAYVVCSLIEASEKLVAESAEKTLARLEVGELAGLRLGLLHGKMTAADKEATMDAFRAGDLDVLVATTVIEVGVDVPNATVMVILDADRFGIAQLHQLRGRVGRGAAASTCWLVTTPAPPDENGEVAEEGNPRIEALVRSENGFELAEIDLALRGEGTLMGTTQKGRSDLRIASLRDDADLIDMARDAAFGLVDDDPTLSKHEVLRDEINLILSPEDAGFLFKS
jgi:ATP-dependent DNA helicase RecG